MECPACGGPLDQDEELCTECSTDIYDNEEIEEEIE